MRDTELFRWPLTSAADAIAAGTLSAGALAEAQLARIAATDAAIEACAHLDPPRVRAEAVVCDARKGVGRGPLEGIGVGVKDIIPTVDEPMQLGSPIYAGHRPEQPEGQVDDCQLCPLPGGSRAIGDGCVHRRCT